MSKLILNDNMLYAQGLIWISFVDRFIILPNGHNCKILYFINRTSDQGQSIDIFYEDIAQKTYITCISFFVRLTLKKNTIYAINRSIFANDPDWPPDFYISEKDYLFLKKKMNEFK